MAKKVWNYKNKNYQTAEILTLAKENNIPPIIALLLKNRGITEPEKIRKFIKKSLDTVLDPFGLLDMEKAVARIIKAIDNKEKITVYGDYDVDGVTATAMLVKFLKKHNADVSYYIPNRESEGYGINVMAVNKISKTGTKLMITVDCGITSAGEVELAKTLGMDVIITDHHLCKEKIPQAVAVINPKRPDSEYEFDGLAGVGVCFKLVLALAKSLGEKTSDCFYEYVELAAIGTVADMVPLLSENRVIVEKGLGVMSRTKNQGIKALLSQSGADKRPINATTIAFMLAPRINAGGRMSGAGMCVDLLLCEDADEAMEQARELEKTNSDRRISEQQIFEEALELIKNDADFDKKKVVVLGKEGWHPGVIGIAAARICEKFNRPAILVAFDEKGNGKGSGRSVEGFHLFEALGECADLLTTYGGHAMAAGIGVTKKDINAFSVKINEYAKDKINTEELVQRIDLDCELSPAMVTISNAKLIEYMEPFGEENPKPVFSISNARVEKIDLMGSDKSHLRLTLKKDEFLLNSVGFRMSDIADYKKVGDSVDVAFSLEINNFRGEEKVQLILKDVK